MDLEKICLEAGRTAREAGELIIKEHLNARKIRAETKGVHDFVTETDKRSEALIIERLGKIFPLAGFIAEESGNSKTGNRFNWIIDPLDGTTNFIHSLFPFSVSIAFAENDRPVAGVVYEIGRDELYYAWRKGGAWCNGTPLNVSPAPSLNDSLLATGFPFTSFERIQPYMKLLEELMQKCHGLRRFGSAAVDLAWLAAGKFDGFFEYNLNPWDVAAGVIIVQEAGGKVTDFSGGDNFLFGKEIVASNSLIHDELLKPVKKFMHTSP